MTKFNKTSLKRIEKQRKIIPQFKPVIDQNSKN